MDKKGLIRGAAAAFTAQGISAAVSALTVFLLAGNLHAAEYGLWQLYTLAGSFSGLFHLGLCDGIYLRLGGRKYSELDYEALGWQFRRMLCIQALLALPIALSLLAVSGGEGRIASISLALIYAPIFNASAYLGYLLQATGRTAEYSMSTVIDRVAFAALAVISAFFGGGSFVLYILASIGARLVSLLYCVVKNSEVILAAARGKKKTDREKDCQTRRRGHIKAQTAADITAGSKLLLANLTGQLIGGAARIAIIFAWGDAEFGRISFVLTLSGLFLQFAAQIGMVIFPSLRREERALRDFIFVRMRTATSLFLPALFIGYLPAKLAVNTWLPHYSQHIVYLALVLPLCFFEGRTQLINQTYLKVSRKEGRLLAVNLMSAGLSIVLCFFAAFFLRNIGAVLAGAVISSAVRCYLGDICVPGGERRQALMTLISDLSVSAVFVVSALALPDFAAAFVYFIFYLIYLFIRRDEFGKKEKQIRLSDMP